MNEPGSTPSILIRAMHLDDVPAVHAIDQQSFSLPWTERSYRFELTQNESAMLWVAEIDQQVVGMIVVWVVLDEAHIASIAVHPDYRQLGIGRLLLGHALLQAMERGATQALLEVRRGNLPAQQLYRQFGFVTVGMRPRYYRDNNEDALLLTLQPLDAGALQTLLAGHKPAAER